MNKIKKIAVLNLSILLVFSICNINGLESNNNNINNKRKLENNNNNSNKRPKEEKKLNEKLEALMAYLVDHKIGVYIEGTLNEEDIQAIKSLINDGANINYKYEFNLEYGKNSYTLLIISILLKNTHLSKWLIGQGANINESVKNFFRIYNGSPLEYAIIYNPDLIQHLINLEAMMPNRKNQNPLMLYITHHFMKNIDINILKYLIEKQKKIDINAKDIEGNTALTILILISIIQQKANYLRYCEENNNEETIMKLLIEAGVDPNIANDEEKCPLDYELCAKIWDYYKRNSIFPTINDSNALPLPVNQIILSYI